MSKKLEDVGQRAPGGGERGEIVDGFCGRWHPKNVRDQGWLASRCITTQETRYGRESGADRVVTAPPVAEGNLRCFRAAEKLYLNTVYSSSLRASNPHLSL